MAVVGSAEIIVRAITNRVREDITKAFRDARPAVAAEGNQAGKDYADNFRRGLQGGGIDKALQDVFKSGGASDAASVAGQDAGRSFSESMNKEIGDANIDTSGLAARLRKDAEDAADEAGQAAGDKFERRMSDSGNRGGNAFSRALSSGFAKEAMKASGELTQLIGTSNLLGPAIASAVSAVSALVSGLFAMGSAAGVAAGGLAVLPGILVALGQGMATFKLAFSGIGKAVAAGMKPAAAATSSTVSAVNSAKRAVESATTALSRAQADANTRMASAREAVTKAEQAAARSMADARQSLRDAYTSASDAMITANQRVSDANDNLKRSQSDLAASQRDLNAARKDAIEQLQQLAFSAEDASLAEQRAALNLQDAHDKLAAAQALPPDSRGRKEAELNFKEADLAYREAKDRNSDLAKEQAKASKSGVEGTKGVIDAHKKVNDASQKVNDAEQALAKARADRARQERDNQESIAKARQDVARAATDGAQRIADAEAGVAKARLENARSIADAQKALADAQQRLTDAQKSGSKTANAYQQQLKNLSPAAQKFTKYLVSLKDTFKGLKQAAGVNLFPGLEAGIKVLIANALPQLETALRRTGGLLGDAARGAANVFNPKLKNRFAQVLKDNNDVLEIFTHRGASGENAVSRLIRIFFRLVVAINPLTKRFATWLNQLTILGERSTRSQASMNKLTGFFNKAGTRAALLGKIFHNLFSILFDLGKAADPAGVGLLKSFEKATAALDKFLKTPKEQKVLRQFFKDVATNMRALGRLANAAGAAFLSMGDNKGVGKLADSLIPAVNNVKTLGDRLTAAAPALGPFATQLTGLVKSLTQTSQVNTFIKTLTDVIKVIRTLIHWFSVAANWIDKIVFSFTKWLPFGNGVSNITGKIGKIALTLFAVHRALAFAFGPIKFFFLALTGGPLKVVKAFSKVGKAIGFIFKGKFKDAFGLFSKSSDKAKDALERQMKTDKKKTKVLRALEKQADKTALALERMRAAAEPGASQAPIVPSITDPVDPANGPVREPATPAGGAHAARKPKLKDRLKKALKLDQRNEGGFIDPSAFRNSEKIAKDATTKTAGHVTRLAGPFKTAGKAAGGFGKSLKLMGGGLMALTGGPIGLLILALPLLILAFKKLYQSSPQFRKFVNGIVNAVKPVVKWIGTHLIAALNSFFGWVNKVLPKIGHAISAFVGFFRAHWKTIGAIVLTVLLGPFGLLVVLFIKNFGRIKSAISTFVGFLKNHWKTIGLVILGVLTGPLGVLVILFVKHFGQIKKAVTGLVNKIRDGVNNIKKKFGEFKDAIGNGVKFVGKKLGDFKQKVKDILEIFWAREVRGAKKIFQGFQDKIRDVVNFIKGRFENFKNNMRTLKNFAGDRIKDIKGFFGDLFQKVKNVVSNIGDKFGDFKSALRTVKNFVRDRVSDVKGFFGDLWGKVRDVFNNMRDKFTDFKTKLGNLKDDIVTKVNSIKKKFGEIGTKVASVFTGLPAAAKKGMNLFIDFMNTKLIDKINSVTKHFGLKIKHIPGLAEGGPVEGQGGPREDNQIRRLSVGEYVIKNQSVKAVGQEKIDYINRYGRLPGTGGAGTGAPTGGGGSIGGGGSSRPAALSLPKVHLPNVVGSLEHLFEQGIGKTLGGLVKGTEKLMGAFGIKRDAKGSMTINNFAYAIMDKLAAAVKNWGKKKDDANAAAMAAANSGGFGGAAGVWQALRSAGFSKVQTAGIMGNMQAESGFSPTIVQGGGHSMNPAAAGGGGYGLVQWTPGRKLIPYLKGRKPSINSEVDALVAQLKGRGPSPEAAAGRALFAAKTLREATTAFELKYERHAGGAQPARYRNALNWYNTFKSGAGSGSPAMGGTIPSGKWTYPLAHRVPITQYPNRGHNPPWSVDLGASTGTGVRAASSGIVELVRHLGNRSYGNYIRIQHVHGVKTLYAHLSKILVRERQRVRGGQTIGYSGASGHVTGPHLHFELMPSSNTVTAMRARGVRLAKGGIVPATPGGILSIIGEAGRNERVEPLARDGFSDRDRAMVDLIKSLVGQGGGSGGDTIHVHPSRGMNEIELANLVSRRVAWKRRPGT